MSGPAALTGPRKRFDSFDQLEEGTKILRRRKKKKKKRSGRNGYNPAWILSFFFFFLEEGTHESHTEALVMGGP